MIIYCNGDSFVSGVELADDTLPEHPGYMPYTASQTKRDSLMKWMSRTYDPNDYLCGIRSSQLDQIQALEYQRAWPKKIQDITKIPVINHAQGGSSLDRIVRVSLGQLAKLSKTEKNIVAIIGTTCPSRSEIACANDHYHQQDYLGLNKNWEQVSTTYRSGHQTDLLGHVIDYKLYYERNYHQLVNAFKNIILLQDFCKVNKIELYWIASYVNLFKEIKIEPEITNREDLDSLMEYCQFEYTLDMRTVASQSKSQEVLCPALHFSQHIHQEVADALIKKIML